MGSLQRIIRNKFVACAETLKRKDILTDQEYKIVSDCSLNGLLDIESCPSVLEQICEGEKVQTAAHYDRLEKKYHRNVAKIYRKARAKPTLPRIVEVPAAVVPTSERDTDPISSSDTRDQGPASILRETTPPNVRSQPPDPYQIEDSIPDPIHPVVVPLEDDNFGSNEADGARDFLELCTGMNLPPMSLDQTCAQELLLEQLGIEVQPRNDNFQDIDLRDIGTPLFRTPMEASTPYETIPRWVGRLPHLQQNVIPPGPTSGAVVPEKDLLRPSGGALPMNVATNVSHEAVAVGEMQEPIPSAPQEGAVEQPTDQFQPYPGAVMREGSMSSVSTEDVPPAVPRSRRVMDFNRILPQMEDILPRARRSFDIFSYHQLSNPYPMIEFVQSQLFQRQQQQPRVQPQPHVDSLVMRDGRNAIGPQEPSILQQSNDRVLRDPFTNPAVETSDLRSGAPPAELSHSQGLMASSGRGTTIPPLVAPLPSFDGKMIEMADQHRLPSLTMGHYTSTGEPQTTIEGPGTGIIPPDVQPTDAANERPIAQTQGAGAGETATSREERVSDPDLNTILFNQVIGPAPTAEPSATAQIDTMLLDILIVVQGEMCQEQGTTDESYVVPIQRLKQLLKVTTRIDAAKVMKNILLLKQARLLDVACSEANAVQGVCMKLPPVSCQR